MILWVYVPTSSNLCFMDGKAYDRNGESDQDITNAPIQIEDVVNRKSSECVERKIYPHVTEEHLKLQLLEPIKKMAKDDPKHPWHNLDDREIMLSAGVVCD